MAKKAKAKKTAKTRKKKRGPQKGGYSAALRETVEFIARGERALKAWSRQSGEVAERMSNSILKSLTLLRNEADELRKHLAKELAAAKKRN